MTPHRFRAPETLQLTRLTALLLSFLTVLYAPASAQSPYLEFTTALQRLESAKAPADIDGAWSAILSMGGIPLVASDSVAFLYRGPAKTAAWVGDFNGWGQSKTFRNKPVRLANSDIWMLKASLPSDARVDYKILLNGEDQILDPLNPSTQWSGVGGGSLNSELKMPDWKPDPITGEQLSGVPRGHMEKDLIFNSKSLGYQVTYSIYTPPVIIDPLRTYPVLYVMDGYEYMHERMGNLPAILDNLIHEGKIEPVVAVFIDHRQPVNRAQNRRMQELAMNAGFAKFLTEELVPYVESGLGMRAEGQSRAVIGTSMGGLASTWLAFKFPSIFTKAGVQSPAFWFRPEIYSLCEGATKLPEKVFISTGVIHDNEEGVKRMVDILDRIKCPYQQKTVNQGHSWGNWRDLTDDMLIYLYPASD